MNEDTKKPRNRLKMYSRYKECVLDLNRQRNPVEKFQLNGIQVERVHKITYLGTIITNQLDPHIQKTQISND